MRNIGGFRIGQGLAKYTTTQLTDLVAKFGATGTQEANALAVGTLVFDTTAVAVKVFNGTEFAALAFVPPPAP